MGNEKFFLSGIKILKSRSRSKAPQSWQAGGSSRTCCWQPALLTCSWKPQRRRWMRRRMRSRRGNAMQLAGGKLLLRDKPKVNNE